MWERTLLQQCGNTGKAPAGADTTAAVWKYRETPAGVDTTAAVWKYREGRKNRKDSCGSRCCCGSVEIQGRQGKQKRFLQEQMLLRQCGNVEKAPAGADTAAAVWKYREGYYGSGHCCGSVGV
ncbi:hypothetical protein ROHU_010160 [Labeo rohita]|uniref:Uncharacterized protein n=1 Tax=Labeo rohita TaxID=84645 RepID=A0A498M3V2_LABRO|nr:hypothetical protein ROHU_010160 [Labeo rohita]